MKWMKGVAGALALAASVPAAADFGGYGIMGVRIAVTDDAKSMAFYTHLGMKVGRLYHPGQQEMTWEKPGLGPTIVLHHKDASTTLVPGSAYFLMFVPDIATTVKELRAAGFKGIEDPKPSKTAVTEHMIKDPDGNQILLIAPTPK